MAQTTEITIDIEGDELPVLIGFEPPSETQLWTFTSLDLIDRHNDKIHHAKFLLCLLDHDVLIEKIKEAVL